MNILITGATGLVGSALCDALTQAGHAVGALSRSPDKARSRLEQLAQAWPWTPLDGAPPPASLSWADAVIHLAGETVQGRWTDDKKKAILDSRVVGTRHLVEGLAALDASQRPQTLISASAIGYYGERGDDVLSEEADAGSDFLAEVCAGWESEASKAETLEVRTLRVRIGIVLSREGGALKEMLTPAKLMLNGPMGSGKQWWSWIHIEDLIRLFSAALDRDWSGALNATAPHPERQKAFAKTLGKVIGRPAFMPVPAAMLKLVLGGFSAELLTSRRVVPRKAIDAGFEFSHPELKGALEDLMA